MKLIFPFELFFMNVFINENMVATHRSLLKIKLIFPFELFFMDVFINENMVAIPWHR